MRKHKLLTIGLSTMLVISTIVSGCGKGEAKRESVKRNTHELVVGEVITDSSITVPEYDINLKSIPENEATEFVKNLGIGWNLGNTLDAVSSQASLGANLEIEMSWCGVYTTQEMVDCVKSAGFNTIRIPVSFHNHLTPNYTIAEEWLDRVEEVVRYAYDDDLYIILDVHHDVEKGFYYPDEEHLENSKNYMTRMWEQLAERFKNYDEKLIFEAINEPRLKGEDIEWWYQKGNQKAADSIKCINELNQVFVDTVRNAGGFNTDRFLMIPSYDQSLDGTIDAAFELPTDTIENHLILAVHAYTPYDFALNMQGTDQFTDKGSIDYLMSTLYTKYVSSGIPVVLTEFGAVEKQNLQERVNFTAYYTAKAAESGIPVVWWDNHAFDGNGECFGILDRRNLKWVFGDILNAMLLNSGN